MGKHKAVTLDDIDHVSHIAKSSQRQRSNLNYHELSDPVQRMLNAVEPGTYVRPHRHSNPPKSETFLILRGKVAALFFDEAGTLTDVIVMTPHGKARGVDIEPGVIHSLLSLEPGSVLFESKRGPYDEATDKDFMSFSPEEGSDRAREYLSDLEKRVKNEFGGTVP